MTETDPTEKASWIVEAALEVKAERPVVLKMSDVTSYADTFVILTGRSDRQVRSIADAIVYALKEKNDPPLGVEGLDDGNWVLIDCNDSIVHVFDPETRDEFDLERLWRDAPRIDLGIEGVDANPDPELNGEERSRGGDAENTDAADPAA